jgi:hypothetical protein
MGFRAVALDGLTLFFTGLLGSSIVGRFGLNVVAFSLGVLVGLVSGTVIGMRFGKGLAEKGEVRLSHRIMLFLLLVFGGVLSIFVGVLFILDIETKIQLVNFLWPAVSFFALGRIVVFLRWELKHKLRIRFGSNAFGVLSRIYTTP